MADSLAGRIRKAAQNLGEFRCGDLADATGIKTFKGRQDVRTALQDFLKRGEMARVSRGLYRYVGLKRERTKLDVIWHLVRSHRHFGLDELERLSGAARSTVAEYVQCLVRAGYLRKTSRTSWLLVSDPGPERPVDWAKCERLAEIRRRNGKRRASLLED